MGSINQTIFEDLYRHQGLEGFYGFLKGWFKPGFRYFLLFRLVTDRSRSPILRFFFRILIRHYKIKYGFEIDKNAEIGEGFYLSDHYGTVVIGPVKMGKYCNVAHLVTIGRSYRNGIIGRPTFGDRVWIGTGSVIVGKISVGSNVLIAPNTFLNVDVPDHSIVMGNPAKIIRKENPTKYYINYILGEKNGGKGINQIKEPTEPLIYLYDQTHQDRNSSANYRAS